MRNLCSFIVGKRCCFEKTHRRRGWLVGIVDRPHDVINANLVDAEAERECVLDPACSDREVSPNVFAGLERILESGARAR
jgi:hypothetical protein